MKKKVLLLLSIIILCVITFFIHVFERPQLQLNVENNNSLSLKLTTNGHNETIYPWVNTTEGNYYFFLPSCINTNKISIKNTKTEQIRVNKTQSEFSSLFTWIDNEMYEITVQKNDNQYSYQVVFMTSANIPSIFIETESNSMEYLKADKENKEAGTISIYKSNGNLEYNGQLKWISGRGNSTWNRSKKPYTINLQNKEPLLGMDEGNKWCLLALWYEPVKLNTKIVMDIASELGLPFTPKCTWVDLYLNGEYNGIYLLCEAISVENGRIEIHDLERENMENNPDIDHAPTFNEDGFLKGYNLKHGTNINGGYLVEKDAPAYYSSEKSGFMTKSGHCFTLKSPQHASREQIKYISEYFQTIEDMIINNEPDFDNYIDLPSFSARYLVDEISFNTDSNMTSMYFYKDQDDNFLYAGPVWDYDLTMGWGKNGNIWTMDYKKSKMKVIVIFCQYMKIVLYIQMAKLLYRYYVKNKSKGVRNQNEYRSDWCKSRIIQDNIRK